MTFEELLENVKQASALGTSTLGAHNAFVYGTENEVSPADQDALEEAVREGAESVGRDAETQLFLFTNELELLAIDCELLGDHSAF